MERNWHVLYTQKNQEKKLIGFLEKKGIAHLQPVNSVEKHKSGTKVLIQEPLFSRLVFAHLNDKEIQEAKKLSSVEGFLYWRSTPAIIPSDEIEAIKTTAENYCNIKLEKTSIVPGGDIQIDRKVETHLEHNVLSVQQKALTVTLPTLGYVLHGVRKPVGHQIIAQPTGIRRVFSPSRFLSFMSFM